MLFDFLIVDLDREYTAKYGDVLPESGKGSPELLLHAISLRVIIVT